MIVELADLKKALDLLAEINKVPLASIEWRGPEGVINLDPEEVSEWEYVGLSNVYFAREVVLGEERPNTLFENSLPNRRVAPWPDFIGYPIFEGDTLVFPDGEEGTVVYLPEVEDPWRLRVSSGEGLRLCCQIGDRGQGIVKGETK